MVVRDGGHNMPIDPASLEAIRNPTGGKLAQLGQAFAQTKQRNIQNERAKQQLSMEKEIFNLKKRKLVMESKQDELAFSSDVALSMKAYYDQGGTSEGAETLYQTHLADAETLGYQLPEKVPSAEQATGLAARSKQFVNYLNATKSSDSTKKWQFIAQIASIPEGKRTDEQKRMLEELTRPDTVIKVPGPTGRIVQVASNFMKNAKVGDIKLSGEIEGEEGYRDEVMTRAQAIQADSKKPISLSEAMSKAHEELKYKLMPTNAMKIPGTNITPFGKEFLYNPDALPTDQPIKNDVDSPSSLKEGESGVFNGYEYKRENGKLLKRKVE